MRIGYLGDGPWARQALDRFVADPDLAVAFLVPRRDAPDADLIARAQQAGIDVLRLADVNEPASLERMAGYEPDVLVSMSFDQIVRSGLLALCAHGAVNCHAGALPFYRGRNVLNWALINDEREFGVTVHYMDEGIDTGDIILQRTSPITDDDDYASVLDRAAGLCAETLHDALRLLAAGQVQPIHQETIHPVGFYVGRRGPGDEWLDWSWPSRRVFNFVRAITTPGPAARTWLDGVEVKVLRVRLIPGAPDYLGTPGEIVGRSADGAHVKTGDSLVVLTELEPTAPIPTLRIGHRFQSAVDARLQDLTGRVAQLEAELRSEPPAGHRW